MPNEDENEGLFDSVLERQDPNAQKDDKYEEKVKKSIKKVNMEMFGK